MMSLNEEIEIYRFGQGAYPVTALLARFASLEEFDKRMVLYDLYSLILRVKPLMGDGNQAIIDSGLNPANPACMTLKNHPFTARVMHIPQGDNDLIYRLLLYVFKQAYQRQLSLKKDNPTDWQYTDLARNETVQELLTKHQSLSEEIYTNPSFRNEFASLAKLWHNAKTPPPKPPEPAPEGQTNVDFMSYDDLITESVNHNSDKNMYAASLLHRALRKGLALRYQLDAEKALRLLIEVVERHTIETYGTRLFR